MACIARSCGIHTQGWKRQGWEQMQAVTGSCTIWPCATLWIVWRFNIQIWHFYRSRPSDGGKEKKKKKWKEKDWKLSGNFLLFYVFLPSGSVSYGAPCFTPSSALHTHSAGYSLFVHFSLFRLWKVWHMCRIFKNLNRKPNIQAWTH